MNEKRTAAQIRAYCEAATEAQYWDYDWWIFGERVQADLPRLLDAAAKLREMVSDLCDEIDDLMRYWHNLESSCNKRGRKMIDETAWLEELSPEPALSPDGENEEGEA